MKTLSSLALLVAVIICGGLHSPDNAHADPKKVEPNQASTAADTGVLGGLKSILHRYPLLKLDGSKNAYPGKYWNYLHVNVRSCDVANGILSDRHAKAGNDFGWLGPTEETLFGYRLRGSDDLDGRLRAEFICARGGGQLGRVFAAEPTPTVLGPSLNSATMPSQTAQ